MFEGMSAALGVTLVAAILLIVINIAYRFLVNQDRAAEIKERMKEIGKETRKAPPDKQKELMAESMKYQKQLMHMNMKPMILSFIIVIILLPWIGSEYHDISASITDGTGSFMYAEKNYTINSLNGNISIVGDNTQMDCQLPCDKTFAGNNWHIFSAGEKNVQLSLIAAMIPAGLPIIGGWQLGWIWWYILVSIPIAIIIRAVYGIRS